MIDTMRGAYKSAWLSAVIRGQAVVSTAAGTALPRIFADVRE
jgi:hypothetical protein